MKQLLRRNEQMLYVYWKWSQSFCLLCPHKSINLLLTQNFWGILALIIHIAFFNKIDKKKFPICICLEHIICLILIAL